MGFAAVDLRSAASATEPVLPAQRSFSSFTITIDLPDLLLLAPRRLCRLNEAWV